MLTVPLRSRPVSPAFASLPSSRGAPPANILLFGTGAVGSEVVRQVAAFGASPRRADAGVRVVGIANRRTALFDRRGIAAKEAAELCRSRPSRCASSVLDVAAWRAQIATLATLPGPVLVDCTDACEMEEVYEEALARGVHVVTANKKPLVAKAERIARVKAAAASGAQFRYEATVGAGLPVVGTLQSLVRTGDRVGVIDCALSSTLGVLSDALGRGIPLSRALADVVSRGLTEPDPCADLSGLDVARKAVVLARELGAALEPEDVVVEPIVPRSVLAHLEARGTDALDDRHDALCAEHVARITAGGRKAVYLARIMVEHLPGGRVAAHALAGLVGVDRRHPAATLTPGAVSVAFYTERYGHDPLVVQGGGAGASVTAAAIVADVLDIARTRSARPVRARAAS
jgi:homoserine dehydrogenase